MPSQYPHPNMHSTSCPTSFSASTQIFSQKTNMLTTSWHPIIANLHTSLFMSINIKNTNLTYCSIPDHSSVPHPCTCLPTTLGAPEHSVGFMYDIDPAKTWKISYVVDYYCRNPGLVSSLHKTKFKNESSRRWRMWGPTLLSSETLVWLQHTELITCP